MREAAQLLRKNMTEEEKQLWYQCLNKLPVRARRQYVIGRYIVDFYIPSAKLVIELDGMQHLEPLAKESDEERDAFLRAKGLTVVRYTNWDIHNRFSAVCDGITGYLLRQ